MSFSVWTSFGKVLHVGSYLISAYVVVMFWMGHGHFNSVMLHTDTDYLHWSSRLPAVSICQAAHFNSTMLRLNNNDELDFVQGIVRPRKSMCRKCNNISSNFELTAGFYQLALSMVASCKDIFHSCRMNGKHFDCCKRFSLMQTKKGICYSINSEMTQNPYKMSVSHFARDSALHLFVNFPAQVFIHDTKEVNFLNSKAPLVDTSTSLSILYHTRETVVDPTVRDLSADQRGCVVEGERSIRGYSTYSRSSCQAACLAQAQVAVCACHHHLLAATGNSTHCNLTGLQCLDYHFNSKNLTNRLRTSNMYKKCNCLQSCDQQEVKVIWGQLDRNASHSRINVELQAPPTERLVLKARIDLLDILVGFACFTRLFTSVSLLDIITVLFTWVYPRKVRVSYRHILH